MEKWKPKHREVILRKGDFFIITKDKHGWCGDFIARKKREWDFVPEIYTELDENYNVIKRVNNEKKN